MLFLFFIKLILIYSSNTDIQWSINMATPFLKGLLVHVLCAVLYVQFTCKENTASFT
jgi:hypothetical protein